MDAMGLAAACCIIGVCRAIGSLCGARVWLRLCACACASLHTSAEPTHKFTSERTLALVYCVLCRKFCPVAKLMTFAVPLPICAASDVICQKGACATF